PGPLAGRIRRRRPRRARRGELRPRPPRPRKGPRKDLGRDRRADGAPPRPGRSADHGWSRDRIAAFGPPSKTSRSTLAGILRGLITPDGADQPADRGPVEVEGPQRTGRILIDLALGQLRHGAAQQDLAVES